MPMITSVFRSDRAVPRSPCPHTAAGKPATTTPEDFDTAGNCCGRKQPQRVPLVGATVALSIWFGGMALLALVIDPQAVVVFGPRQTLVAAVDHADASLISMGRWFTVARSEHGGIPRKLYAGGAWFVWPAIAGTCPSAPR